MAAIEGLAAEARPRFQAAICRPWLGDVVLAFRVPPHAPGGYAERVWPDKQDDRILVQFTDGLGSANIVSAPPEPGRLLAAAVAARVLGAPIAFDFARNPLTPAMMQGFHERLTRTEDPRLKLVEIEGESPGLSKRPLSRIASRTRESLVPALHQMWASEMAYARDFRTVAQAKVEFEGHRIQLHYPDDPEAEQLEPTFTSRGLAPDVAGRFQRLFRNEHGVHIHPRCPADGVPRRAPHAQKPGALTARHWNRILGPAVNNPASWELDELGRLRERKLLDWEDEAVFRCGSPEIFRRPAGAAEGCTGVVRGQFGMGDSDDPLVQPDGPGVVCPTCHAEWDTTMVLPWFRRAAVRVDEAVAWDAVLKLLSVNRQPVHRSSRGLAAWIGDHGDPCEVIAVDLVPEPRRHAAGAAGRRAAWFGVQPGAVSKYGARGVALADVLAGDLRAIERAHAEGPVPASVFVYMGYAPAAAAPPVAPPPTHSAEVQPLALLQRVESGALLGDHQVVTGSEQRLLLLLATLQYAMAQDAGTEPRRHYSGDLLALYINDTLRELHRPGDPASREVSGADIHQWILRLRRAIDERRTPPGQGASVIEHLAGAGYRLGSRYELRGFSMQGEALRYKADPRTRAKDGKA